MPNKAFTSRKGFTLIELIIVIAILATLATISISGYLETRRTADINIQTDTIVAKLREAKGQSQNATPINDTLYCIGYFFSRGQKVKEVKIPYNNQFTPCLYNPEKTIQTDLPDTNLTVKEISVIESTTPTNQDNLTILYYPPKGEFKVYPNSPDQINDTLSEFTFDKIQISSSIQDKESSSYITISKSGIIQKELIEPNNQ